MEVSPTVTTIDHLILLPLEKCDCGHLALSHWHHPGCRACDCNRDPVCSVCGELTSRHEIPED